MTKAPISLISTVRNEENSIIDLLSSIACGSLWPEEMIIVDGGSSDHTIDAIEYWRAEHPGFPLRLIRTTTRVAIAAGRNMAIRAAHFDWIAVIDSGCLAQKHWLRNLMAPFFAPDPPDVVAGWYEPRITTSFHRRVARAFVPRLSTIRSGSFLPSSRSVAFTRHAWSSVGGYPEKLRFAGEDTLFDLRLKQAGFQFLFVPEAIVLWCLRDNLRRLISQYFRYGYGDGEARILSSVYLFRLAVCLMPPLIILTGKCFLDFWLRYCVYVAMTTGWLLGHMKGSK